MKFLIVAAKTGGHVFPAASVARELIKKNHEIVFLGTGSKIEKTHIKMFHLKLMNYLWWALGEAMQ